MYKDRQEGMSPWKQLQRKNEYGKVNGLLPVSQYFGKYPFFDGTTKSAQRNIQSNGISCQQSLLSIFISLSVFVSQWNGSTTYDFAIERDFGTDYGICCWYTPQHNLTEVQLHQERNNLSEPDWGKWFQNLPKVSFLRIF